jgi:hypothetical protein
MVGALIVTLLVIFAFVGFRAFDRRDLEVRPQHIDYLTQVRYAQQAGSRVAYPAHLPTGWYATQVTVTPGTPPGIELSFLTATGQYVGFVDSPDPLPQLLSTYVDPHAQQGAPVTVGGGLVTRWQTWTDGSGDTALVATRGTGVRSESLLVFGTVTRGQLEAMAATLTTAPLGR